MEHLKRTKCFGFYVDYTRLKQKQKIYYKPKKKLTGDANRICNGATRQIFLFELKKEMKEICVKPKTQTQTNKIMDVEKKTNLNN